MDQVLQPSTLTPFQISLEDKEVVFEIIHKHWGKLLVVYIPLSILFILSLVLTVNFLFTTDTTGGMSTIFAAITFVWFIGLLGYGFSEHYSTRRSVLIITNQRIIDCQQLSVLSRRIQTIDIYEIQSCSGNCDGPLGILLNYGQLWINTIGDKPFCVDYVPRPEIVAGTVMRYHNILAHGNPHATEHSEGSTASTPDSMLSAVGTIAGKELDEHAFELTAYEATATQTVTLLMFHIPSERFSEIRDRLPAQKEPTVRYLQKTDYYEVEIMVPTEVVPTVVSELKEHGAENIVGKAFDMLDPT